MPVIGHRNMTSVIPTAKEMIPRRRSFREKNRSVLAGPMVRVRPVRKSISPSASSPASNMKRQPRNRKMHPKKSKPVPNFVLSLTRLIVAELGDR